MANVSPKNLSREQLRRLRPGWILTQDEGGHGGLGASEILRNLLNRAFDLPQLRLVISKETSACGDRAGRRGRSRKQRRCCGVDLLFMVAR